VVLLISTSSHGPTTDLHCCLLYSWLEPTITTILRPPHPTTAPYVVLLISTSSHGPTTDLHCCLLYCWLEPTITTILLRTCPSKLKAIPIQHAARTALRLRPQHKAINGADNKARRRRVCSTPFNWGVKSNSVYVESFLALALAYLDKHSPIYL
jgi:hypothetical protein